MANEREKETHTSLKFEVLAECSVTRARTAILTLPHYKVETPVFMPVGTQGTMKGLTPEQLTELDCQIILGNTYHLGMRPVSVLEIMLRNAKLLLRCVVLVAYVFGGRQ